MPSARKTPKAATNLSVRADLVRKAKELKINLSVLLESALQEAIAEHERAEWLRSNEVAIEGYNAKVARQGVFSDGRRRF